MAMKDELSTFLRERFSAHESPVDPGLWQAIEARIDAAPPAPGDDAVDRLFKDRLEHAEMPVDPALWTQVSAQLGQAAAPVAGGSAWLGGWGWVAAGVGALAVTGAAYFWSIQEPGTALQTPVPTPVEQPLTAPTTLADPLPATAEVPEPATTTQVVQEQQAVPSVQRSQDAPVAADSRDARPVERLAESAPMDATPMVAEPRRGAELVERIITEATQQARTVRSAPMEPGDAQPGTEPEAVTEPDRPAAEAVKLFLPNTFTPNGDGVNDTYQVLNPEDFARITTRVFAVRTDRLVFRADHNEPWTGEGCQDGYYVVAVEAVDHDGRLVTQGKVVWLTREPAQ